MQVFSGGAAPDPRRAARQFKNAQVVVGPHGAGLANLIYAEPATPVFLLPTHGGGWTPWLGRPDEGSAPPGSSFEAGGPLPRTPQRGLCSVESCCGVARLGCGALP